MSNGGAQQHNLFLGASYPGFTIDFYVAGDATTGKNVWHDEGKTTSTQQITADSLGMAWWYADGDYLVDIKDSSGILLWSRDLWKMSSDTGTLWEGNQGTQYPPASSTNSGQMFALIDGSSNIIEIGYNDGSGFRRISGPEDVVSKSSDHTVALNEGIILVDASGGSNITSTLHTAVTRKGKKIIVKKTDSTSNTVIIDADGSETIDGSATQTLTDQYQSIYLISDGTNWILASTFTNLTHDHTSDAEGGDFSNRIVGRDINLTSTMVTGTTVIPALDNTKPQNTDGFEVMTLAYTPIYDDSTLVIESEAQMAHDGIGSTQAMMLFQDSDADALVISLNERVASADFPSRGQLYFEMVSGTTSQITFKIRIGSLTAGTLTFNGSAETAVYDGTFYSHLKVTELKV